MTVLNMKIDGQTRTFIAPATTMPKRPTEPKLGSMSGTTPFFNAEGIKKAEEYTEANRFTENRRNRTGLVEKKLSKMPRDLMKDTVEPRTSLSKYSCTVSLPEFVVQRST